MPIGQELTPSVNESATGRRNFCNWCFWRTQTNQPKPPDWLRFIVSIILGALRSNVLVAYFVRQGLVSFAWGCLSMDGIKGQVNVSGMKFGWFLPRSFPSTCSFDREVGHFQLQLTALDTLPAQRQAPQLPCQAMPTLCSQLLCQAMPSLCSVHMVKTQTSQCFQDGRCLGPSTSSLLTGSGLATMLPITVLIDQAFDVKHRRATIISCILSEKWPNANAKKYISE